MPIKHVTKRKQCHNCYYPEVTCVCQWLSPIISPLRIIILQHPKEATHAKKYSQVITARPKKPSGNTRRERGRF
ncbi:DTW domain-containing protein [Paraglaciecola aquimarina]|uniref:tRNA-uridine aminocarboxypropyltransferase n=1 Tax=Paraglaciecola aquimarina TaxID=1235557 RepID=A0ABU3STK5_9ALTE|nr:DTW domain-containing protein [Paraglaciecola aquimarina]MDU0353336.1 DTW domain-containing protein [Paraglaciecola aquimarina]